MDVISILMVDDHPLYRKGVISALKGIKFISKIHEASSGSEALTILKSNCINIVLLDISMPGMNGEETAKEIRKLFPKAKILVLTMHDDSRTIVDMFKLGVNGYLLKNTDRHQLETAMRVLMEGKSFFPSEVSSVILSKLNETNLAQNVARNKDQLSDREIEIIRLICKELSSKEIAIVLNLSKRTVDSHRNSILQKTNSKNLAGLIQYAIKSGIL